MREQIEGFVLKEYHQRSLSLSLSLSGDTTSRYVRQKFWHEVFGTQLQIAKLFIENNELSYLSFVVKQSIITLCISRFSSFFHICYIQVYIK